MIHSQNDRVVASVPTAATGSTATATMTIDTKGFDHASVTVIRASAASTTFANALKIEEGDTTSSYSDVTALVAGGVGGFTVPAISVAGTNEASVVKMDVDTKAKKRYLRVSYTPGASAVVALTARLSRGEDAISSNADAGVLTRVVG